jgi:hypothetical protein
MRKKFIPLWLAITFWWLVYSMFFASSLVSMSEESGTTITWIDAFKKSFMGWVSWIPITLGIIWIVRKYPLQRSNFLNPFLILNIAAASATLVRALYVYLTNPFFNWYDRDPLFLEVVTASLRNNFMLAWLIIGIAHAIFFYQRVRLREREILQLRAHLATEKLKALSAQLNPHFLFNVLNSIAELIHIDPNKADNMLVSLSALLRRYLSASEKQEISLAEEIELTDEYLKIEKIRLEDRINIIWKIDAECLSAYIPEFVLQPLAENAIIHSISRTIETCNLLIAANKDKDMLIISVENNGSISHNNRGHGISLRNLRERLICLYGEENSSVELSEKKNGYVSVQISIPFQTRIENSSQRSGHGFNLQNSEDISS